MMEKYAYLFKLFKTPEKAVSDKEDWNIFLESPMSYAQEYGRNPLKWQSKKPQRRPDIFVNYAGKQIAFIQSISFCSDSSAAYVGHFATDERMTRQGIGKALASAFFEEIHTRYGIETLIFSERSTQYEKYYPPFFEKLGAHPQKKPNLAATDWHWEYSQLSGNSNSGD
jgi:ribosomal protein S18 acetylase RimI-like enzyme